MNETRPILDALHVAGLSWTSAGLRVGPDLLPAADAASRLSTHLYHHYFQNRTTPPMRGARASGDAGFVAHLTAATRGASGWESGFKLLETGEEHSTVSNGRVVLHLDEFALFSPRNARKGDAVLVCFPRARENAQPWRFALFGGQGPVDHRHVFAKYFLPVTVEGALSLVAHLSAKVGDYTRFCLWLRNDPRDYARSDTAILDVGHSDEPTLAKALGEWRQNNPHLVRNVKPPCFSHAAAHALAHSEGRGQAELGEGFGRTRCDSLAQTLLEAVKAGEATPQEWATRLKLRAHAPKADAPA